MPNRSETLDGPARELVVALGLLRIGGDTRGPRLFRTMVSEPWTPIPAGSVDPPAPKPPAADYLDQLAGLIGLSGSSKTHAVAMARQRAREALAAADGQKLTLIPYSDRSYPPLLWHIPDPPIALWVRGDPAALSEPSVAIVGSRDATPVGLAVARKIGREVAEAGLTVVSGMARGIDAAAHTGALDAGGRTVAVLGCGADVVYPWGHRALADSVTAAGAIVSELPPGSPPLPHHFPLRNRIISGLSKGVVVVEATERSGSLITARAALEQGRDVLAVPGAIASGKHRGCHGLIKDGARLVETVEDILEQVGWLRPGGGGCGGREASGDKSLCYNDLSTLMAAGEPYELEDLVERTGRTVPELLAELADLELSGKVTRMVGGGFVRLD
jgi:DNA processing protein